MVREWNDDEGTGVIDSEDTPGGCWFHFSDIVSAALGSPTPGEDVTFTFDMRPQDGFRYRAVRVWRPDVKPGTPRRVPDRGPSAACLDAEPQGHLDVLYAAVRDDAAVDRQAAFDLAMNELEYFPLHAEGRELAEASVADGDETGLASAAAAFLDAIGYEPGFEQAPERFARAERALDAVRADMWATGLREEVTLVRPDWTPNAVVETSAGDQGWTGGIFSADAADDLSALVAVAEQARQAIMESLGYQSTGRVWPACPAHGLGTTPVARHGIGVWWCNGGDGHVPAQIGRWPMQQQAQT